MKKLSYLTLFLLLGSLFLFAQDEMEAELKEMEQEIKEEISQAMEEVENETGITIDLNLNEDDYYDKPFMGVFFEDLSLKKARELKYNQFYGILITGVVKESPAKYFRLLEDDIIMQIGEEKVIDKDKFGKIISSHYVGEKVKLKIFRFGKEKVLDFMFGARNKTINENGELVDKPETIKTDKKGNVIKKKKLSTGHGGGSWIPVWFVTDLDDVNKLITDFEFSEVRDNGMFFNGGGGKGPIGKGLFLGGMGAGYGFDRKKGVTINENTIDEKAVTRRMKFSSAFGGVTLDKRFAFSRKILSSLGFMLGWGGYDIEVSQTDGNYNWDELEAGLTSSDNNTIEMQKKYILLQPKVMLMFRLTSWLALRAEGGYMLSYSYDAGWNSKSCDDVFEIENSPETAYDGYTISIGPWFGF
ncbi:MAG: PDZ domain-containing protein [Candidatus Cloacimonetes bacterium]|nr:PDZ domain-containing protein [Candidatus Cloacimonadota bacterium]